MERRYIWYNSRIFICPQLNLKEQILMGSHDSSMKKHPRFLKTYQRIKKGLIWEGIKKDIQKFVIRYQRNKGEVKHRGLLHPLHMPNQIWQEISMDFNTRLPKSEGKDSIYLVAYRLTS